MLDESAEDSDSVKRGIKIYISISTFLISLNTCKKFTRYLNLKSELVTLKKIIFEFSKHSKATKLGKLLSSIVLYERKLQNYTKIVSEDPERYSTRNRFGNVIIEKLRAKIN